MDLENRLLFARHVKNNRPQPLPLCSDMVAILQEYLTYREGKAHEPLFPSDADQPMTENGLRCSVANYNRKRGVEKTSNLMQLIAPRRAGDRRGCRADGCPRADRRSAERR